MFSQDHGAWGPHLGARGGPLDVAGESNGGRGRVISVPRNSAAVVVSVRASQRLPFHERPHTYAALQHLPENGSQTHPKWDRTGSKTRAIIHPGA